MTPETSPHDQSGTGGSARDRQLQRERLLERITAIQSHLAETEGLSDIEVIRLVRDALKSTWNEVRAYLNLSKREAYEAPPVIPASEPPVSFPVQHARLWIDYAGNFAELTGCRFPKLTREMLWSACIMLKSAVQRGLEEPREGQRMASIDRAQCT